VLGTFPHNGGNFESRNPPLAEQSITDAKGRHADSLQYTARGWHAFNAAGAPVGVFEHSSRAIGKADGSGATAIDVKGPAPHSAYAQGFPGRDWDTCMCPMGIPSMPTTSSSVLRSTVANATLWASLSGLPLARPTRLAARSQNAWAATAESARGIPKKQRAPGAEPSSLRATILLRAAERKVRQKKNSARKP
jgi:hypothetical protein